MILAKLAQVALGALLYLGDPLSFEFNGTTDASGQAFMVVKANESLEHVKVTIKGDDQTINKDIGSMKAGQSYKVVWKQRGARAKYQMEVTGGSVEANFGFEVVKQGPTGKIGQLKPTSSREDLTDRNRSTYQTPFTIANYEYKVYDSDGDVIASDLVTQEVPAGSSFTITWPPGSEVFMIFVRAEDEFGRFTEYKLVPWSVEIPHTEINFDSGKWDIKNDEAPKLDEAVAVAFHELAALDKVNKAVNANLTPQLYIVGYTDTVGSAAANQKLSNNRARQIAEYFRDKGFWAEIYYAGMGEKGLRVQTDDNVDEVRNRRALYLIGVQKPAAGGQIPARWTKLVGARQQPPGFQLPPLPERWANYREDRKRNAGGGESTDLSSDLPEDGEGTAAGDPSAGGGPPVSMPEDDDGGAPPPIEGEPTATSKGCSITPRGGAAPGVLALLALATLSSRRRRRR